MWGVSVVIGARKIQRYAFANVLEHKAIPLSRGLYFRIKEADELELTVEHASSTPTFRSSSVFELHNVSVSRRSLWVSVRTSGIHASLYSLLLQPRCAKVLEKLFPFFSGSVRPAISLAFRELYASFCALGNATISGTDFLSHIFRHDASNNAFAAIASVREYRVSRYKAPDSGDPYFFLSRPIVTIINLVDNLQYWFKSQLQKTLYPVIFMAIFLQRRFRQMCCESFWRVDRLSNVTDRLVSWVNESVDKGGIIATRLGHLLQQATHRFTSDVCGLAAQNYVNYTTWEAA